jgi:periplasmic copper chaperone A
MNPRHRSRRLLALPLTLILGAGSLLAACGDDDDATTATTNGAPATTSPADQADGEQPEGDELAIADAWARTSPAVATNGAVYMVITNPTDDDDALVAASVDPSVAATAEVHETTTDAGADADADGMNGGMNGGTDDNADADGGMNGDADADDGDGGMNGGMMTMREVDEIPIPAGATVILEPGGYHVMLLDLAEPLTVGDTIEVTLTFAGAGEIVVEAEIRDTAP